MDEQQVLQANSSLDIDIYDVYLFIFVVIFLIKIGGCKDELKKK